VYSFDVRLAIVSLYFSAPYMLSIPRNLFQASVIVDKVFELNANSKFDEDDRMSADFATCSPHMRLAEV